MLLSFPLGGMSIRAEARHRDHSSISRDGEGWALIEEPLIDRESYYQNPGSQPIDQIKPIKRVGLTYAWCHYYKEM